MEPNSAVKVFVQEVLGCGCPEEVFNKIETNKNTEETIKCELIIGERLLIRIVEFQNTSTFQTLLENQMKNGITHRDKNGFNRFRLVIACSRPDQAQQQISGLIKRLEELDGKAHLHLINNQIIPSHLL